jgi:hypothetical protein
MIPTLRRLDEGERYLGLTLPMWAGAVVGGVVLYLGVRFSPLAVKPTITITLFACAFTAMIVYGVSGQALSPTRQLWAIVTYLTAPKLLALADKPDRGGLMLAAVPRRELGDTGEDLNAARDNVGQSVGVEDRLDAAGDVDLRRDLVGEEDRWDPDGDLAAEPPQPASGPGDLTEPSAWEEL